jgi:DNA cross-link repair 1A protein
VDVCFWVFVLLHHRFTVRFLRYTQPAGTNLSPTIPALISRAQSLTFTSSSLRPTRQSTASLTLYGVPYSEHSSFFELTCFALSVEWGKIVATVNVGSEASRGRMGRWIERWEAERRRRRGCGEEGAVRYRTVDYW